MDIGIPAEVMTDEFRVGLTPRGVSLLTQAGHRCYIERGAGEGAGFANQDYERAGGLIVYGAQEVYQRADFVLKVGCPTLAELDAAPEGQTICAFWHLAARAHDLIPTLVERRITAIAYEAIQTDDGLLPVLHPLSQIAGRMSPQIAAHWLQNDGGGSGVLISGIAGIPPVTVCILGAGVVGTNAAIAFHGLGARVTVLDNDMARLQQIEGHFQGQVTTMVAYNFNIARAVRNARVLIGAVLERGHRAPVLVTRERGDQPPNDPRRPGVRRGGRDPLLRAEHAGRGRPDGHQRLPERRLALHPAAGRRRLPGSDGRRRKPAARGHGSRRRGTERAAGVAGRRSGAGELAWHIGLSFTTNDAARLKKPSGSSNLASACS
jgi:alanine dehydrogenase